MRVDIEAGVEGGNRSKACVFPFAAARGKIRESKILIRTAAQPLPLQILGEKELHLDFENRARSSIVWEKVEYWKWTGHKELKSAVKIISLGSSEVNRLLKRREGYLNKQELDQNGWLEDIMLRFYKLHGNFEIWRP